MYSTGQTGISFFSMGRDNKKEPWWKVLSGQILNSSIVAGIAALSMLAGTQEISGRAVSIAFGLTFLIELRKYRK